MRLLTGVLLIIGLLLQAVDIILPASRKELVRDRFQAISSVLRSYAALDIARWALASFSGYLDLYFSKRPFGMRSMLLISIIHLCVFAALLLLLLHVVSNDDRRLSYGWAWQPSMSDFDEAAQEAKRLQPSFAYPDYDSAVRTINRLLPIVATTWLIASLSTSCLLSYISLGITRVLLRRALRSANLISLCVFVLIDFGLAALLILLFSIMIVELSATAVDIIVAMDVYWLRNSSLTWDTVAFYAVILKGILLGGIVNVDSIEWIKSVKNSDQLMELLGAMSMSEIKRTIYEGMVAQYLIDMKHVLALEWGRVDFASSAKNWSWTLTLLPSIAYLVYMGFAQLVASRTLVQRALAGLLAWLARRDRGPIYVVGWALLALFAVIRFAVL